MPTNARYYMSRVIKVGQLDNEKIIAAIQNPVSVEIRGNRYTFTNFQRFGTESDTKGIFARLAKYKPEGAVEVVRPETHAVDLEEIENLIEASSPFVYLPEFSGIAFKHIWNTLPRERFERAFCELIDASQRGFFVRCELEPITDLRTFVARLARLDRVVELQAAVKPPNPLFGPCWKSLNDYLKKRQLEEVSIKEESPSGIVTNITQIALAVDSANVPADSLHQMMEPLLEGVGDAALLWLPMVTGAAKLLD